MSGTGYVEQLLRGERRGLADRLLLAALRCAAVPYAALQRQRARAYSQGILRTRQLPRPVISVGNLVAGGTGKTPMVIWLARYLQGRGRRVCVLSRGYGGSKEGEVAVVSDGRQLLLGPNEAGDEPYLLASQVPGLAVVIGSDRYRAGLAALAATAPDIFLLDDGFQHLRLHRDLNLLLLDCHQPLATGLTFPAGLLREPPAALGRADLLIFTRCGVAGPTIPAVAATKSWCTSRHQLTGFSPLGGGEAQPFLALAGKRGVAIAGIAHPASFFNDLRQAGLELVDSCPFRDHRDFSVADLTAIREIYESARADYLIMTAKDAVKLAGQEGLPACCLVAGMCLAFDDPAPLTVLVEKLL